MVDRVKQVTKLKALEFRDLLESRATQKYIFYKATKATERSFEKFDFPRANGCENLSITA
jgi:hypothetical protein